MIRTPMNVRFGEWLKAARRESIDPTTGEPFTQDRLAELMGISKEKWSSWETGRRPPTSVEDVAAMCRLLGRTQREALAAIGYDVGDSALTDRERHALKVLQRFRHRPEIQEQAILLLQALRPDLLDGEPTDGARRPGSQ